MIYCRCFRSGNIESTSSPFSLQTGDLPYILPRAFGSDALPPHPVGLGNDDHPQMVEAMLAALICPSD